MYKYIPHITYIHTTKININTVVPCSILPVATVPLPEMENVSSIAMMKGFSTSLFGVGILDSTWTTEKNTIKHYQIISRLSTPRVTASMSSKIAFFPMVGSPPVAAAKADPLH